MKLSDRITQITGGGSDGWDVFYRARRMVAEGHAVTQLTIGEHDIGTDASILDAMNRSARDGHTGYAMVPGTDLLRDTVAARVQTRTGVSTTRNNVLITPGGQAGLFAAHMAVCNPGDVGLFLDPYYATYPGTIRGTGAVARAVQTSAEDAFQPRAEQIEAKVDGAVSLLINTPNNPTGVVYSPETLRDIAELCQRRDLWLISDEVYDTQIWNGAHLSPRALPGMADRTLVVGSMSKSHAMTGSRCGWIIGPEEVISHLINLATHTTYGVPGFIQDAASFALSVGITLEDEIAAPFRRRRARALEVLAEQNTIGLVPADGAMYLMLDIRATGLTGEGFANALLDKHAIAVMPGESFGTAAAGHVRVAMTVDDDRFETALKTICAFASELAGQQAAE
ncbi:pyridoxal phosphate-dependent aminotransferase [Ruegeria sp. R13_0]|uniref:pyridoxal phosphate-dependent aminotransferase n=1 Tax=Ruegeria sp. R13_0 TaxID=2821099 RepID=UPI001ADCC074|nr:pyridoxal phosphate-dependent aminotransferase [Ruegeria sp. R13_0]MBO9435992.1 pyridoxal phosphate-dependent aminotransferase [Ruegeria sp. R13_0]